MDGSCNLKPTSLSSKSHDPTGTELGKTSHLDDMTKSGWRDGCGLHSVLC